MANTIQVFVQGAAACTCMMECGRCNLEKLSCANDRVEKYWWKKAAVMVTPVLSEEVRGVEPRSPGKAMKGWNRKPLL